MKRILLINFQTFGDFSLKLPFIHELKRIYGASSIYVATNERGALLYPLLDCNIEVLSFSREQSKISIVISIMRIFIRCKFDDIFVLDQNANSYLLSLLVRAKRKHGFFASISNLFVNGEFSEVVTPRGMNSRIIGRYLFSHDKYRQPDNIYEGFVELSLLGLDPSLYMGRRLAEFRDEFTYAPPKKEKGARYVYCSTNSGWAPRSLTKTQWIDIIKVILEKFPSIHIIIHGDELNDWIYGNDISRIQKYAPKSELTSLFDTIMNVDMVITVDSFLVHLASMYDIPVLGFYGPALPHRFIATSPKSSIHFNRPPCSPCVQDRSRNVCQMNLKQCISLSKVDLDAVAEAVSTALAG